MALPIGGFMPIPLAMMIPFMATQSMVMGDAFGRAFQYGKRKISAMSNEEFNKTTLEQQASEMFAAYKNIIPTLQDSMAASSTLQKTIIDEMLLILPKFLSETGTQIFGTTDIDTTPTSDHAHTVERPHTHSNAAPTIVGQTTAQGITTYFWSDGTQTTSSSTKPPPAPKQIEVELTENLTLTTSEQTYTITYFTKAGNSTPVTQTFPLQKWKDLLNHWRTNLNKQTASTKSLWLQTITKISNSLHTYTGKWY